MSRIKLMLQVAGVTLAGIGVCCLPLGVSFNPNNPKQDMSMFIHMADLGFFVKAALILIPLGLIFL